MLVLKSVFNLITVNANNQIVPVMASVVFQDEITFFWGTLIQFIYFLIIQINIFQDDLSGTAAKTVTLVMAYPVHWPSPMHQ